MLLFEAVEPVLLPGTPQLRLGLLRQREVVLRVLAPVVVPAPGLFQRLVGVLSYRLEHAEPGFIVDGVRRRVQKALVGQVLQTGEHICGRYGLGQVGRLHRARCEAAREHRDTPEQSLLGLVQQIVTPRDGAAQGALPGR